MTVSLTHTRVIRVISCCNCIHITQMWFTNSMTCIMKQDSTLWTGTSGGTWWRNQPHIHCFMTKFNVLSLQIWTLRITSIGVQKMPCYSTKYHYMTLMVVCGKLWVQLGLLGPFFPPKTINSHWYFTQILIQISNTYSITDYLCHSSERQCNSLHCKQFIVGDIIIRGL